MSHPAPHRHPNHRANRVAVAYYLAAGGPDAKPILDSGGNLKGRTRAGEFVLEKVTRHISSGRWKWSMIPWGAELRDDGRKVWARLDGRWKDVEKVTGMTRDEVRQSYRRLYQGDLRVPDKWVFNDFGHLTVYYFRDSNHNRIRDKGEGRMGDMIHPTPESEAQLVRLKLSGRAGEHVPLTYSHGCVHVRPDDLDEMVDKKYIAPKTLFVVHPYTVQAHDPRPLATYAEGPYEVHFYPKTHVIIVYGWQPNDWSRANPDAGGALLRDVWRV